MEWNGIVAKKKIQEAKLIELVENDKSAAEIASYFDISTSTVYKHLRKMKISLKEDRSASVAAWKEIHQGLLTAKIIAEIPNSCYRHPYQRPVTSLQATSPTSSLKSMEGRDENVLAPLSVFHFGGFYKMAKFGFAVLGCIDVYSRYITYLDAANNNRASTVLRLFQSGVAEIGLPVRIRCDNEAENVGVVHFMAVNRPQVNDRVVLQPAETNNRFKSMWGDVVRRSLKIFIDSFTKMEKEGKLDPSSDLDIYCLHQCYLPLMKNSLKTMRLNWNDNKSNSEMTPRALTYLGQLALKSRAASNKIEYVELNQGNIIVVDEQEWSPTEDMNRNGAKVRVVKPLLDATEEAEMSQIFGLNFIDCESGPQVYELVRSYVRSILDGV